MDQYRVTIHKASDEKIQEYDIFVGKPEENTNVENVGTLEIINNLLINEYNIERNKRNSFENRALGVLAFNGAILSIFLTKIDFSKWKASLHVVLTYYQVIIITSSFFVFFFFLRSLYYVFRIVQIKQTGNTDIDKILGPERLKANKQKTLNFHIRTLRDLINFHRDNNIQNANLFQSVINNALFMLAAFFIYFIGHTS